MEIYVNKWVPNFLLFNDILIQITLFRIYTSNYWVLFEIGKYLITSI